MKKTDLSDILKATRVADFWDSLKNDRIMIVLSFAASLVTAGILFFTAIDKDRIETVFLEQDKVDVPTLLNKVRDNENPVKTDRWVRGFARRVVGFYFVAPDDSAEFARHSVAWLHAHSGIEGQERSESFMENLDQFETVRKQKYTLFYPVNDPSAIKIRPSDNNGGVFYVEIKGTYNTHVGATEAFYPATLKLVIEKIGISGFPSKYDVINLTGLQLVNGTIEFVDDITKEGETTRVTLFKEKK